MGAGLIISRAAVSLDLAAVRVDVREFETLIALPDATSLERAAQLYRDDFLSGFVLRGCPDFEEWQDSVAEGLRQSLARGLQRLVAACVADGDLERAAGHARRWLQLDPLHEPAHQAIIRLHGWAGQRSAAMRQYRSLVRVLDRELAVRPLPETTKLYDDVRAGRLGPPPAPSAPPPSLVRASEPAAGDADARGEAAEAGAASMAAGVWPLLGRDRELAVLRAAWQATGGTGRVVAIAGQAGSGKTRLITEFRDEVARNAPVLAARCHDGETALPFVLAADLLRTALAVRPDLPDVLPAQTAAMAGRLVPALAAAHPDSVAPALDSPVAVTRLYAAIADTLLAAAAGPGPGGGAGPAGVVVVEDVHWADSSSVGLLAYLVRRLADWPLLLVLSWQAEQARAAAGTAHGAQRGRGPVPRRGDRAGAARARGDRRAARPGRHAAGGRGPADGRDARAAHAGPRVRRGAAVGRGAGARAGRLVAARQRQGPAAGQAADGQRADPADADRRRGARQRQRRRPAARGQRAGRGRDRRGDRRGTRAGRC